LEFLRDSCGLKGIVDHHAYSQGRVIEAVFEKAVADAGIVDEDPGRPHHRLRDQARVVKTGVDVDVLELRGKRLCVIKPDLEKCFIGAMKRVKAESWFQNAGRMHQILASSASREHKRFKDELELLRQIEVGKRMSALISELVAALK